MYFSKLKLKNFAFILCILNFAFFISCSQPVLEPTECIAARDQVKRFYSYHFGNDMKPTAENLEKRQAYLSQELRAKLKATNVSKQDYFTQTEDYPKAFRAGKCEQISNDRTKFEVLLFWRTNDKSIQREIAVETVKENDKWLVDKVTSKK